MQLHGRRDAAVASRGPACDMLFGGGRPGGGGGGGGGGGHQPQYKTR